MPWTAPAYNSITPLAKNMNNILTLILGIITLSASAFAADWTVVSTSSAAFKPEESISSVPGDFWLHITLRNDSKVIQYVQGIGPGWFMIEAFIRRPQSGTWERENCGVCQKLEWIAIKPGEEVKLKRRQSAADVGLPMMLTFSSALSSGDDTGSIILLDQFIVPAAPKNP
jgi:hypothetical protein